MYKKNGKKKKEIAVEENSQLSLGWMDRKYIFFPNIEDRHKNGVVSSLNVTSQFLEPRTFLGFSRSSLATGHTMHTGTLHPPSPSRPPANEHGGHSPTVCQSPSSYAFFMGQLGKVGFLPVEISDWYWLVFSFFGLPSLSLLRDTIHKIVLGFLQQPSRENFLGQVEGNAEGNVGRAHDSSANVFSV